ncbi:MAG TPA: alpha/beta hydrolase [Thermoanaerobaculia bacterium]
MSANRAFGAVFVALSAILVPWTATEASAAPATESLLDHAYAENPHPEQHLDFHWPKTAPAATVLFIHGGSLQENGERRDSPPYRDVCRPFLAAGLACATTDYRLAPSFTWPTMPHDVASAVAEVRRLIAERGGEPDRLVLFGHSSGCTLAASLGTNGSFLATVGLAPGSLAGIVAMGCVLDVHDLALRRATADQIRAPFSRDPSDVATFGSPEGLLSAIPSIFVSQASAPTLVVVAEEERIQPPILEQGARFVRLLDEAGVAGRLVIVPGTHMSSITAIGQPGDPTFAAVVAFIEEPTGSRH